LLTLLLKKQNSPNDKKITAKILDDWSCDSSDSDTNDQMSKVTETSNVNNSKQKLSTCVKDTEKLILDWIKIN